MGLIPVLRQADLIREFMQSKPENAMAQGRAPLPGELPQRQWQCQSLFDPCWGWDGDTESMQTELEADGKVRQSVGGTVDSGVQRGVVRPCAWGVGREGLLRLRPVFLSPEAGCMTSS